jgi:DNA-binding PadR family transcriptional regulator
MIECYQKEIQTKLTKGLLDSIILQYLEKDSMHGYQIITQIRKNYGIYFGPSTIYPLLGLLEKKGYIKSEWNMNAERPRKVYTLTAAGKNVLKCMEDSLALMCKNLVGDLKSLEKTEPRIDAVPLQESGQHIILCK